MNDAPITDHAQAAVDYLQWVIDQLKGNASPEDLGPHVILVGRLMARKV